MPLVALDPEPFARRRAAAGGLAQAKLAVDQHVAALEVAKRTGASRTPPGADRRASGRVVSRPDRAGSGAVPDGFSPLRAPPTPAAGGEPASWRSRSTTAEARSTPRPVEPGRDRPAEAAVEVADAAGGGRAAGGPADAGAVGLAAGTKNPRRCRPMSRRRSPARSTPSHRRSRRCRSWGVRTGFGSPQPVEMREQLLR